MKISATNQNINFQGLWENTKHKGQTNYKTGLYEIRETRTYRPFADEDIKEVQEYIRGMNHIHDDHYSRTRCFAKVGEPLPFTEAEYWDYLDIKTPISASGEQWDIHHFASDLYLTSEPYNQESAKNINLEF